MNTCYDDTYNTCKKTDAALRIAHLDLDPEHISARLQVQPTSSIQRGQRWPGVRRPTKTGLWLLDTEGQIQSRDLRRHLDWIIDALAGKAAILADLRAEGYEMDVFCNWVRLGGTGGPTLSPRNMQGLGKLGLELGFEFWSEEDDDDEAEDEYSTSST